MDHPVSLNLTNTLDTGCSVHICNLVANVVLIMSLPQGGHNISALLGAVHTGEEPDTVRYSETTSTINATGPPISQVRYILLPMQSQNMVSLCVTLFNCPPLWKFMYICIPTHLWWFTQVCGFIYDGIQATAHGC